MVPFIYSPREHHSARTSEEYRAKHAAFLAKNAAHGQRFVVHEIQTLVAVRIGQNTYYVDCDCGNGVVADPDWHLACCYSCGAVYTQIAFPSPEDRLAIEAALLARPIVGSRNWLPTERVADLIAENLQHGIGVPTEDVTP